MAKQREWTRRLLYLWPLRVSILTGLLLVAFPWIARSDGVSTYLAGLLDVPDAKALCLVTLLSLLVAWTAMLTGRLVLAYGAARLDLPELRAKFFPVPLWVWAVGGAMAMPVIVTTIVQSAAVSHRSLPRMILAAFAGATVALVLLVSALAIGHRLTRIGRAWRGGPRTAIGRGYQAILEWLDAHPAFGRGFVEREEIEGKVGKAPVLLRGHGLAAGLAALAFLTYVAIGIITRNLHAPVYISTLACVLLLLLLLCWTLGFIAFVTDRTRFPLFVFIGAAAFITSFCARSDHFYRTYPMEAPSERVSPADLLADRRDGPPIIVVAASGGGIQAAAWTARVLTGLDEATRRSSQPGQPVPSVQSQQSGQSGQSAQPGESGQSGPPGRFARSLRLISAVSGGSVGAMYFVTSLPPCGPAGIAPGTERDPVQNAMASSLHAVGWGWVFRDINILPFWSNPYTDRGTTLEQAWRRDPRLSDDTQALLSAWRRNIVPRQTPEPGGDCPALIFNAMVAETGSPLLFSTVDLPPALASADFYALYAKRDLPITTAARLSATFPYVSPAATADVTRNRHVVDGGYYDNYGMASLTALLDAALRTRPAPSDGVRKPGNVLVIEIRESPLGQPTPPTRVDPPTLTERSRAGGGWTYQTYGPVQGLFQMRGAAQAAHNVTERCLLQGTWHGDVSIGTVHFTYPVRSGPLSWHLSETDKETLMKVWTDDPDIQRRKKAVLDFLDGKPWSGPMDACQVGGARP